MVDLNQIAVDNQPIGSVQVVSIYVVQHIDDSILLVTLFELSDCELAQIAVHLGKMVDRRFVEAGQAKRSFLDRAVIVDQTKVVDAYQKNVHKIVAQFQFGI